jgi:uncharacterized protein (TIGR03000 family)
MQVPSEARIWFSGEETSQTGTERVFQSPLLESGRDFVYKLRIQWREGQKLIERTRDLTIRAGDHLTLSYVQYGAQPTTPATEAAAPSSTRTESAPYYALPPAPMVRSLPSAEQFSPPAYDRGRHYNHDGHYSRPGPPGSNDPLSLGVGQG